MESDSFRAFFVVNPRSGGGATGRHWPALREIVAREFGPFDFALGASRGDSAALARRAVERGYEMIVAVGGDGTISDVAAGFFAPGQPRPIRPGVVLGVLPGGTGGDFIRALHVPRDPAVAARLLRGRESALLDAGFARAAAPTGGEAIRHFVNVADFGIGGEVSRRVNRSSKRLGGFLSFLLAATPTLLTYPPREFRIVIDGGAERQVRARGVAVANGAYFGGGMCVAPEARLDDGLFDVVIFGASRRLRDIPRMRRIYDPHRPPGALPGAETFRARALFAEATDSGPPALLDVDGENPGTLPASFEILPAALRVKRGGHSPRQQPPAIDHRGAANAVRS
ncbi:MAG: diacylglycerol kinase family lipid kinase [Planctomycetes bacterium]|nr:diacylglycerol kinase family lipid kinase [Planctomycetota bacterium]